MMKLFARMMDALERSNRRRAEAVLRRHSHLFPQPPEREQQPQPRASEAVRPHGSLTLVRKTAPACATACLALAAATMIHTTSTAGDAKFATACALREIPVITAIEDGGADPTVSPDRVAYASFKMMAARRACYEGQVEAALRLYDEILNVELAKSDK